ncbi:uncharacterized protein Tco025E_01327 [Trypanosoma conorhini]|uniref:Uncharacterized protein n=1 Tax=Trypanosoma conorhini TaxID=83891 RepID=A0A3R7LDS0_9TRYP|nr:uncharacterized protein Tco025E_01327 [Trypanosoma conorhini]RNF26367.1 hypothetical protein Tco025E_01327 [Trypanosoma conorhini]
MRFVPGRREGGGARSSTEAREPRFEVLEGSSFTQAGGNSGASASAGRSGLLVQPQHLEAAASMNDSGVNRLHGASPPPAFASALSVSSPQASSSPSSSSQQVAQLWRLVQDLTAENAVLQQRVRVLMEGETRDGALPGLLTAPASPEETEALLLRVRRLEAALKVEAMEREALEVRLQAQEQVLTRLIRR